MALTPENDYMLDEDEVVREYIIEPSRTYHFDFENGELVNRIIDHEEAIRQFIKKAIYTERSTYLLYDDEYGCEIHNLIGDDISFDYMTHEVERMISEALIYDDRIHDIRDVVLNRDKDKLYITFTVELNDGATYEEGVWV